MIAYQTHERQQRIAIQPDEVVSQSQSGPDDAQLVAEIAGGNSAALEMLYDRYATTVFRMAMRILRNREQAEEVVQEVFWRIWRRSASFESQRGRVAQWLFGITHNLCIDELRRQRSRPAPVYEQGEHPVIGQLVDERIDIPASAWANEQRRLIDEAMEALPSSQREAVQLMYFGGLSHQEIASKLDRPLGTIKTRVRLGLQKLNGLLTARGVQAGDAW